MSSLLSQHAGGHDLLAACSAGGDAFIDLSRLMNPGGGASITPLCCSNNSAHVQNFTDVCVCVCLVCVCVCVCV